MLLELYHFLDENVIATIRRSISLLVIRVVISWDSVFNCDLVWDQSICEQGLNYLVFEIKFHVVSSQIKFGILMIWNFRT
jgi:hypothetical protein